MRKLHTSQVPVVISNERFMVSPRRAAAILELLRDYQIEEEEEKTVPPSEAFKDLYNKYGKSGSIIRGYRAQRGLTQFALAKNLGVTQGDLSKMENGKRPIGKDIAHRLAKIFDVNYRVFL
jgi:DNA-binding XRE family transcriptional regulator